MNKFLKNNNLPDIIFFVNSQPKMHFSRHSLRFLLARRALHLRSPVDGNGVLSAKNAQISSQFADVPTVSLLTYFLILNLPGFIFVLLLFVTFFPQLVFI